MATPPMYVQQIGSAPQVNAVDVVENVNDSGTVVIVLKGNKAVVIGLIGVTTGTSVV